MHSLRHKDRKTIEKELSFHSVGIIGGTGDLGRGLAVHLAKNYRVQLGSREKEKASSVVQQLKTEKNLDQAAADNLLAYSNADVAAESDLIIATLPQEAALPTITSLKGSFRGDQLLISAVATLQKSDHEFVATKDPSISKQFRSILPDSVEIATAFQTIPAQVLYDEPSVEGDVLVACDKKSAYESCAALISSIKNLRPLRVGSLEISGQLESMTGILLNIAIKNRLKSPTFKILDQSANVSSKS
jgi:8-hydroxy-5-deazaflavin:NADPH oxidoreductase